MAEDVGPIRRSKVHSSHKTRSKIANWRAYERGLVERVNRDDGGDIDEARPGRHVGQVRDPGC